jgi:predicted amidohydrolase YtcJ
MRALRFDKTNSDPPTGRYGRDAAGEFTGMLYGSVGELIDKQLPPLSHAQSLIGAKGVVKQLNRVGITSIQDMSRVEALSRQQLFHAHIERSFTDLRIFSDLRERGELTLRVYAICRCARGRGSLPRASVRARATRGCPTGRSRTLPTAASCCSRMRTTHVIAEAGPSAWWTRRSRSARSSNPIAPAST